MHDESTILRYLRVREHAVRGVAGERDNAVRILAQMDADYPGIGTAATQYLHAQETPPPPSYRDWSDPKPRRNWDDPNPEPARAKKGVNWDDPHSTRNDGRPSGVWPKHGTPDANPSSEDGNWENIFNYARAAFNGAKGFAETVAAAAVGRDLASYVDSELKMSRAGNILMTLKMPLSVFQQVSQLNAMQRAAFRQTLHEYLDAQLDSLLGEEK